MITLAPSISTCLDIPSNLFSVFERTSMNAMTPAEVEHLKLACYVLMCTTSDTKGRVLHSSKVFMENQIAAR